MVQVWVYQQTEFVSEGGVPSHFWLVKLHSLPGFPPPGWELDYRGFTGETVKLERILVDPGSGEIKAVQQSWLTVTSTELQQWEAAGWQKLEMTAAERESQT